MERKISTQCDMEKIFEDFYKNRDKILQKRYNGYLNYKDLLRSYVELENKLKVMQRKFKIIDSSQLKYLQTQFIPKDQKRISPQINSMFVIVMTFGL